jgi:hypothetical protein
MTEQQWGPYEKFVDWRQCATFMLLCLPLHNSGALPPVHELFKRLCGDIRGAKLAETSFKWGGVLSEERMDSAQKTFCVKVQF